VPLFEGHLTGTETFRLVFLSCRIWGEQPCNILHSRFCFWRLFYLIIYIQDVEWIRNAKHASSFFLIAFFIPPSK